MRISKIPILLILIAVVLISWTIPAYAVYARPTALLAGTGGVSTTGGKLLVESSNGTDRFYIAASSGVLTATSTATTTPAWSFTPSALTSGVGFKIDCSNAATTATVFQPILDSDVFTAGSAYFINCLGGSNHATSKFSVTGEGNVVVAGTLSAGSTTVTQTATAGVGLTASRNLAAASTDDAVVYVLDDSATDDQPTLKIKQDGTGNIITGIGTGAATTFSVAPSGLTTVGGLAFTSGAFISNTDGSETLTAALSGTTVVCTKSDGTTTVTLPDPSAATVGVMFRVIQTADQNVDIVPTTANGNSIVADNVATSDKVSLATASHKIGAGAMVIGISATQWWVGALNPTCPLTVEAAD